MTLIQDSIAAVPLTGARGDVFPLPTTLSAEDEVLVTAAEKGDKEALEAQASREAGHRVWLRCVILVLNALAFSPQSFIESRAAAAAFSGIGAPSNDTPVAKAECLRLLEAQVRKFCQHEDDSDVIIAGEDFEELLKNRQVAYDGTVVSKACHVTWAQLKPGLPAPGVAGQVDAHALSEGRIREIIANPELIIKPKCQWPRKFKKARVMVSSQEEWDRIGVGLADQCIIRPINESDVLYDEEGNPLTCGVFGVGKGKTTMMPDGSLAEILRLIANLIPSNEVQEQVIGDNGTLPYPGCWQSLLLESDTIVFWNSEDMQASLFLFKLPPAWGKYFVLSKTFGEKVFGQDASQEVHACLTVVPMGWLSATGIVQYLHRRLAQLSSAVPRSLEVRRDRPPPSDISFSCPRFYQIYIDNFDEAITSVKTPTVKSYAVRVRATGETLEVSYDNGEKRAVMRLVGKTLGAHVEGRRRKSWPLRHRSTRLVGMTLSGCGKLTLGLKELEVMTGMWVHTIQWNRALATRFEGTFACIIGDVTKDQRWPNQLTTTSNSWHCCLSRAPF